MRRWRIRSDAPVGEIVTEVATLLDVGSVIALPTETYYGLAAHYLKRTAHERIFALKGREADKPLPLLVEGATWARRLAPAAPADLERLAAAFWPGPLTLAVPALAGLPPTIVSREGNVAVRHTSHPVAQAILQALGAPITATSANRSGHPPVRRAEHILLAPGHDLDAIVDAGRTPGRSASTVLLLGSSRARILRDGAVSRARLKDVLGGRLL